VNISEYIKYVQHEIREKDYDDYAHVFHEYKKYLEERIKENPKDIEAVCQLAAVSFELRYEHLCPITLMEDFLSRYADEISAQDKARMYTNLAFFYEDDDDKEKCLSCLEKAVQLNPDVPNAYNALGRLYMKNGDTHEALELFEKACTLSTEPKYQYNLAVAFYQRGDISAAKAAFEKLLPQHQDERRIVYGYAACCFYSGEKIEAVKIADELAGEENEEAWEYIAESEIAGIYFLCGEYEKHNEMYDRAEYYTDASWLAPYFYGLKARQKMDTMKQKLAAVMEEKDKAIAEIHAEELDTDFTEADKREYAQNFQKEKDDILQAYCKILHEEYKPEVTMRLWFMYGCYLIDCPRHQRIP
jgi:tetratricopeptide (TPR) repeat protein